MLSITMLSCQVSYSAENETYYKVHINNGENISKLFEKMHILENDASSIWFMLYRIDDNSQSYDTLKYISKQLKRTVSDCSMGLCIPQEAISNYNKYIDQLRKLNTDNSTEDEKNVIDYIIKTCNSLIEINKTLIHLDNQ